MPKANRNKTLKNIQLSSSKKTWFPIAQIKKEYPDQLIRLYATSFKNDFPGQILKEIHPREYIQQKQKLQAARNLKTRKYNKQEKRKSGSRKLNVNTSIANWLERMEKE